MHILFICQTYPEPNNQRKGVFFRDQATAMRKAGHQVGVIAFGGLDYLDLSPEGLKSRRNQLQYIDSGLPVYRSLRIPLPLKKYESNLRLWSITAPAMRTFNRYIAEYGMPDILHSQNFFYAAIAGNRIAQKNGLPHVMTEHSTHFLNDLREDKIRVLKKELPKVACPLAVSQALADRMHSYVPEKDIRVIGNMVNTDIFSPRKYELAEYPFTFVIAGALNLRKNITLTLRGFHQAFAGDKKFQLIICGNGPEKGDLMALTEELDLNDQVEFIDYLPRKELILLYQRSHVIVSSSQHETFGLTLAEAMACGIPAIATQSGGPQDFVTDKVGLLVARQDVEGMAKAMREIHKSYSNYIPDQIYTHIMDNYSERVIVKKLEAIYRGELKRIELSHL